MQRIEMKAVFGLIIIAVLMRLVPHPPNFAPITSIALFSGIHFANKRLALFIPLCAMFLSDLFLGLHALIPVIYLSFLIISVMGFYLKSLSITAVLASSILFFLVSNLGVWYFYYPHSWAGLMNCFILALPFFASALAGDLFYAGALQLSFKKMTRLSFSI